MERFDGLRLVFYEMNVFSRLHIDLPGSFVAWLLSLNKRPFSATVGDGWQDSFMIELANCRKSGDRSLLSGSKKLGKARGWRSYMVCLCHLLTSAKNVHGCSSKNKVSDHFLFCRARTQRSPFPQGVKLISH